MSNVIVINSSDDWDREKLDAYLLSAMPYMPNELFEKFEDEILSMLSNGAEIISMDAGFDPGYPSGRQLGLSGGTLAAVTVQSKVDCQNDKSRYTAVINQYMNPVGIPTRSHTVFSDEENRTSPSSVLMIYSPDGSKSDIVVPSEMLGIDAFHLFSFIIKGIRFCEKNPKTERLYKIADRLRLDIWQRDDISKPLTKLKGYDF